MFNGRDLYRHDALRGNAALAYSLLRLGVLTLVYHNKCALNKNDKFPNFRK